MTSKTLTRTFVDLINLPGPLNKRDKVFDGIRAGIDSTAIKIASPG